MINIGKYRIENLDRYNWGITEKRVREKGKMKGENYYKSVGFFKSLEDACKKMLEILVKDNSSSVQSVKDILESIEVAQDSITKEIAGEYLRGCSQPVRTPLMVPVSYDKQVSLYEAEEVGDELHG